MVTHVMKDGTRRDDVTGITIWAKDFPALYEMLKHLRERYETV